MAHLQHFITLGVEVAPTPYCKAPAKRSAIEGA